MATRLKNIVRFVAVPPGVPTALPHLLNIDKRSVPPDLVVINDNDFSGTANATNVTVTNGGLVAANVDCYVEHWHTFEREFGAVPASYEGQLTPQPFVIGTGSGQFDQEPAIAFVFRPGDPLGPHKNVYTVWADLMAAIDATEGLSILEFDNSLAPCVIPAGIWNQRDVTWTGYAPRDGAAFAEVSIQEGAILPMLRIISGQLAVNCQATLTPPVSDFGPGGGGTIVQFGFRMDDGIPNLRCTGGAPMFDMGANSCQIRVNGDFNAAIIGTNPPARIAVGGTLNYHLYAGTIGPNCTTAPVGSTVIFNLYTGASFSNVQTTILGTFSLTTPQSRARFRALPQSVGGLAPVPSTVPLATGSPTTGQTGDCWQFDTTAGDIAQPLPNIVTGWSTAAGPSNTVGHLLIIKNAIGANNVNVSPVGGQLVDGGAGPIVIPPGGSRTFWSDGVSNWRIVGGYL